MRRSRRRVPEKYRSVISTSAVASSGLGASRSSHRRSRSTRAYFCDFPGGAEGLSTPGASQLMPEQRVFARLSRYRAGRRAKTAEPPRRTLLSPAPGFLRSLGRVGDQFHFDPDSYMEMVLAEVPAYRQLQRELAQAAGGLQVGRILDLGTGTGETAAVI